MKRLKMDRLSKLHDSLIFLILSFLPMRDVVRTTILSKRWKDLWFTLPSLNFSEYNKNSVDSRNFINRALLLWEGSQIQKLEFRFGKPFDGSVFADMDLWVHFAKERNLEELHIESPVVKHEQGVSCYEPPQCLYSCSSITKLSLATCNLQIRGNVHWHHLKSLKLHVPYFSEDTISQVVSSSPQLEILVLSYFGRHGNLTFRSSSLRMLSVFSNTLFYDPSVLTVCAPKLETLLLAGAPYCKCLLTDASSVTDLTLDFWDMCAADVGGTLRQIVPAFHRVESVTLSTCCYKILAAMNGQCLFSPMMNAKLLSITCGPIKPNEVVGVLEIFPKVERLVINWSHDDEIITLIEEEMQEQDYGEALEFDGENYSESLEGLLKQLKIVEIDWSFYDVSMLEFIELVLKHATVIEKIVMQKKGNEVIESEDMYVAAQKFVSLQRAFPNVEILLCKKRFADII